MKVKQTVDACKGNWTYDSTLTPTNVPGMDKPVKFKVTMACKAIAEDLSMHFGKNTRDFSSTTHGKGGMQMVFESKGKK